MGRPVSGFPTSGPLRLKALAEVSWLLGRPSAKPSVVRLNQAPIAWGIPYHEGLAGEKYSSNDFRHGAVVVQRCAARSAEYCTQQEDGAYEKRKLSLRSFLVIRNFNHRLDGV